MSNLFVHRSPLQTINYSYMTTIIINVVLTKWLYRSRRQIVLPGKRCNIWRDNRRIAERRRTRTRKHSGAKKKKKKEEKRVRFDKRNSFDAIEIRRERDEKMKTQNAIAKVKLVRPLDCFLNALLTYSQLQLVSLIVYTLKWIQIGASVTRFNSFQDSLNSLRSITIASVALRRFRAGRVLAHGHG